MLLSEGQMNDYKGAALMIDAFPRAKAMLADRGYDADWFRRALAVWSQHVMAGLDDKDIRL
jgi:transposase